MQITYNLTGVNRKELISAISQELNTPAKYLGMPTASYEVGGYIIDKNGTLMGEDNRGLVADLQELHGYIPISADYDEPVSPTATIAFEDLPLDSREELGLGKTHREDWQGENGIQENDIPDIDQHHPGQYADPNIGEAYGVREICLPLFFPATWFHRAGIQDRAKNTTL